MATTTLPVRVEESETAIQRIPKNLLKELEEIVKHAETEPETVHWYHFVPCAGVRYYTYHRSPSSVAPLVRRKG